MIIALSGINLSEQFQLGQLNLNITEKSENSEEFGKLEKLEDIGNKVDEFEAFRKQRGQMHFSRMKGRDKEK